MTTEQLEPLPASEQRLLSRFVTDFEVPAGAEQRVLGRVVSTTAASALAGAATVWTAKSVAAVAAATLVLGTAGGVLVGRQLAPPAQPAPPIVVTLTPPPAPVPAPAEAQIDAPPAQHERPAAAPSKRPSAPADAQLGEEHQLIETARSALLHDDTSAALSALKSHAAAFPSGRLEEERDALWIQTLARDRVPEAQERLARFHQKFPQSLLGAGLDALVTGK